MPVPGGSLTATLALASASTTFATLAGTGATALALTPTTSLAPTLAAGLSDEEIREFGRLQRERIRRY